MLDMAAQNNWHLVCYECAKKHSLLESYFGSWLRTLDDQTGCMLCGKVASLAEIHVPPEIKEASRHIAQQIK